MPQFHIDEVCPKGTMYPIIMNFQNGYITDQFKRNECFVFQNDRTETKTVAMQLDELLYTGEEEKEDLGKTLILARNKKTGKVRVIEVSSAEMKASLKTDLEKTQLLETSNLELSRKFGSKKSKKQMEQIEKLKVNVDTVTEQMKHVSENITEDKLDLSSYNQIDSDEFYIPPINREATKAEDVYNMLDILTEEQFDKIHAELEGKDYKKDFIPWIKNIIADRKLTPKQTVLAVYANALFKLFGSMMKEIIKKSFIACNHSNTLNNILLTNFTLTNGAPAKRTRPTPYKDKTLCYAIVMVLLINNLRFEIEDLCKTLKLTPATMATKARVTGATIISSGSKKSVQLKLPLASKSIVRRKSAKF